MAADQQLVRNKLIAMARDDARKGNLRGAFRRYQRLSGLEPENPSFHIKLGDLALKLEKQGQAREAYLRGALLFTRTAFEEKAIAIYRRVLEFVPLDLEVWEFLADAYQRADRTGEAIVAIRAAAAELESDHSKHALQLRRKIATLNPTDVRSRLQLAHELGFARMSEEAVSEYVECILQCAAHGEWDRIPSTFDALVMLRPQVGDDVERDEDDSRTDIREAELEGIFSRSRYELALHDMYRRMSELGRQQARSLEAL